MSVTQPLRLLELFRRVASRFFTSSDRGEPMRRILLLGLLFAAPCSFGQSNYAVVRGTVLDPQHNPVPGAGVQITSAATHAVRRAVSNDQGIFEITALWPGDYEIAVQSAGFSPLAQTVRLEVNQQLALDLNLKLASASSTLQVVASMLDVLHTTDASVGEVIEPAAVEALPLNGRMLVDLMLTVPGAHVSHGAQTGDMNPLYWRPGQRSSISVGGNRPNANYFLLDGATNTDPTFNTQNLSASPDAVQEFQVQVGSYSAQMGGAGGGQVNIVTRSGGSRMHGTAYEFLRNGALDAHSFNDMGGTKHLVQNNFGGSLGGPLWGRGSKKGTFFFVNYEGLRHVQADSMTETVATPEEAGGDFSMSGVTIYDPNTTVVNPNYNSALPVSKQNPQF